MRLPSDKESSSISLKWLSWSPRPDRIESRSQRSKYHFQVWTFPSFLGQFRLDHKLRCILVNRKKLIAGSDVLDVLCIFIPLGREGGKIIKFAYYSYWEKYRFCVTDLVSDGDFALQPGRCNI